MTNRSETRAGIIVLAIALLLALLAYLPGKGGGYIFDDFPNIVDNPEVKPADVSLASFVRVALASPSSEFKRPLASLSFAANYLATGQDPQPMKITNIVIHLLNGIACFILACQLLRRVPLHGNTFARRPTITAALLAAGWMLLPINLTAVLYIVQRMESLANLFVLIALIGYVHSRARMQDSTSWRPFAGVAVSMTVLPLLGLLAKETAILVPLYAFLIEVIAFQGRSLSSSGEHTRDRRIVWLYAVLLALPLVLGFAWLLPGLMSGNSWARRDFTLWTRLLSEARIVLDYIVWTVAPTPHVLSFYHDDFVISTGWLAPISTLFSALILIALAGVAWVCRRRLPLTALGIGLYFAGHSLTATIIPLELVYEHRNYFPSFALLLAILPLVVPQGTTIDDHAERLPLARWAVVAAFLVYWFVQTAMTATAWGSPLSLSAELADRGPASARAQYELGRTYIILSNYDKNSPFAKLVYTPLERAAAIPQGSILPEQALIFFNARMHQPLEDEWWDSIESKLGRRKPGVQDESALGALASCQISGRCDLPKGRMVTAFVTALNYPRPSARLQAMYGDYAMGVLDDRPLAIRMLVGATKTQPQEPAYHITLARLLIADRDFAGAEEQIARLRALSVGGSLNAPIAELERKLVAAKTSP